MPIALLLVTPDLAQHGAESFVRDDRRLRDMPIVIEVNPIGQQLPGVTELDVSVLVFVNSTASAYERECRGLGRIRTQNVNIQLRESTPKLSDTRSFRVARARDAEDARLIAVERMGLPWRSRYARVDVK